MEGRGEGNPKQKSSLGGGWERHFHPLPSIAGNNSSGVSNYVPAREGLCVVRIATASDDSPWGSTNC